MTDYYISILDTAVATVAFFRGHYLIIATPQLAQCVHSECWGTGEPLAALPEPLGITGEALAALPNGPTDEYVLQHPTMLQLRKFLACSLLVVHVAGADPEMVHDTYYDYLVTRLTAIVTTAETPDLVQLCQALLQELEQQQVHLGQFKGDFSSDIHSVGKLVGNMMGATVLLAAFKQLVK